MSNMEITSEKSLTALTLTLKNMRSMLTHPETTISQFCVAIRGDIASTTKRVLAEVHKNSQELLESVNAYEAECQRCLPLGDDYQATVELQLREYEVFLRKWSAEDTLKSKDVISQVGVNLRKLEARILGDKPLKFIPTTNFSKIGTMSSGNNFEDSGDDGEESSHHSSYSDLTWRPSPKTENPQMVSKEEVADAELTRVAAPMLALLRLHSQTRATAMGADLMAMAAPFDLAAVAAVLAVQQADIAANMHIAQARIAADMHVEQARIAADRDVELARIKQAPVAPLIVQHIFD